jgi:ribonuclease HI
MKMIKQTTANIKYKDETMYISFQYNAELVALLKQKTSSRKWNPRTKEWAVDIKEKNKALEALKQFCEVVEAEPPAETPEVMPCFDNPAILVAGAPIDDWTDGACRPVNPGGTASYGLIIKQGDNVIASKCGVVGSGEGMSNNVAEFCGLIALLEWCRKNRVTGQVTVHSDNSILVNQMSGAWQTRKSKGLYVPYQQKALALTASLKNVKLLFKWVPREENGEADVLSKQIEKAGG